MNVVEGELVNVVVKVEVNDVVVNEVVAVLVIVVGSKRQVTAK